MATTLDRNPNTSTTGTVSGPDAGIVARIVNIIIGAWLFISAFVWPHTSAARTNTWIVGALIAIFALIALRNPPVRGVNTVLAIWLFFSSLSIHHLTGGTLWNNVIAAIVVFIASLVPSKAVSGVGRPPRYVTP